MNEHSYKFICVDGNEYRCSGETLVQAWAKFTKSNRMMYGVVEVIDLDFKLQKAEEKLEAITKSS